MLLFPFLPVVLRFWDADEEFPASMQILTDRNILDFMRYETLMFVRLPCAAAGEGGDGLDSGK